MPIFQRNGAKLAPIKEKKIDLEKDVQKMTEQNLDAIFGYTFITTEFALNNLRIDTLAFDDENKSFIIIEYKKDRNFSVIDQGYAYLALLLNNKADFILEYNEKMKNTLKRDDIDWSQSRVIFVSPKFTTYQQNAISFKDLPMELWEVKYYDNNTVLYNQLKAANTSESIKTVSKDQTIANVSKEVKEWTVEDHFKEDWTDSRNLYEELKDKILALDERFEESPQKHYIGYKIGKKVIVELNIYKSKVVLRLMRVEPKDLYEPKKKTVYSKNSFKYYNKHITDITVSSSEEIDYAISLAKQVYEKFGK